MRILPISQGIITNKPISSRSNVLKNTTSSVSKKEFGILAGLAALGAITALAVKSYVDNRPSEDINHPIVKLIKSNPKRCRYIQMLHDYPNLSDKYYNMLEKASSENENDKKVLSIFETILDGFSSPKKFKENEYRFKTLEENYSNDIENICINIYNNIKNGGNLFNFLDFLNDKKLSSKNLQDWTKYPLFNLTEYNMVKNIPEEAKDYIYNMKQEGVIKSFKVDKIKSEEENYFYKLYFAENVEIKERINTVIKMHEALYGKMPTIAEKKQNEKYTRDDIETELYVRLQRDKALDALYNLMKYLNPNALKKYNYTSNQIKYMNWNDEEYKQLRKSIALSIVDLDFAKSPKVNELLEVMNKKELFDGIVDNTHAVLRIISRIVLRDNFDAELKPDTKVRIEQLNYEINRKFDMGVPCFKYKNVRGTAPCFYLGKTSLGEYLKVTLNKNGKIQTIFEDTKKGTPHS